MKKASQAKSRSVKSQETKAAGKTPTFEKKAKETQEQKVEEIP